LKKLRKNGEANVPSGRPTQNRNNKTEMR